MACKKSLTRHTDTWEEIEMAPLVQRRWKWFRRMETCGRSGGRAIAKKDCQEEVKYFGSRARTPTISRRTRIQPYVEKLMRDQGLTAMSVKWNRL